MSPTLADHVALITGAGRGIGRATALALAAQGCSVILVARTGNEVEATATCARQYGVQALPLTADVTDPDQVASLLRQATAIGPISILVNNAGAAPPRRPHVRMAPSDWERTLATCLHAPLRLCAAVLPDMITRGRGSIVNIVSTSALRPRPGEAAYAAAKAGLLAFSRALFAEVRDAGVKVISVLPGYVDTAFIPPNRRIDRSTFLRPEDVAAAIVIGITSPGHACPTEILLEPQADPDAPGGRH